MSKRLSKTMRECLEWVHSIEGGPTFRSFKYSISTYLALKARGLIVSEDRRVQLPFYEKPTFETQSFVILTADGLAALDG